MSDIKEEFSIGQLSSSTGVSVYTLRQWERRYGQPKSNKTPTGHRRYELSEIVRVRLVQAAIQEGLKTKMAVQLSYDELFSELQSKAPESNILSIEIWLSYVKNWNQKDIQKLFNQDWKKLGPLKFLSNRVIPFLKRIGESWRLGEISVSQEHFFSELLQTFMVEKWQSLNKNNNGPLFVLAAPTGEDHDLGLHMCALVLSLNNHRILFLGSSTPSEDIISASVQSQADSVCISLSANFPNSRAQSSVKQLKKGLGQIPLIVGGAGAPKNIAGIKSFSNFEDFVQWLSSNKETS